MNIYSNGNTKTVCLLFSQGGVLLGKQYRKNFWQYRFFLNAEKEMLLVLFILGDEVSVLHILPSSLNSIY